MQISNNPNIREDFKVVPSLNPNTITRQYFTFTGLRQLRKLNFTKGSTAVVTKVTMKEFPVLEGQSVSMAVLSFPPGAINPPHIHPRGGELLFMNFGTLEVGFVDSTNKLLMQTLRAPDMFVFPKGMLHFQMNVNSTHPAQAIGMFGSANAGLLQIGQGLFRSGIDIDILAKEFKTDENVISQIVEGFN